VAKVEHDQACALASGLAFGTEDVEVQQGGRHRDHDVEA
jgi:hypothetical protein